MWIYTDADKVEWDGIVKIGKNLLVNGNVGIGISNPTSPLHVYGNGNVANDIQMEDSRAYSVPAACGLGFITKYNSISNGSIYVL